jgi:hypothetical protein
MIINTFISDSNQVPAYTALSLKRARELNPEMPIQFICKTKQSYFDRLNINWVDQSLFKDHPLVKKFNELSWFQRHGTPQTTYPSPDGFWHKTCERIFYLAAYASTHHFKTFVHTENDVLMFYSLAKMMQEISGNFAATIMSETQATFAVMYCPTYEHLTSLCEFMLQIMEQGEEQIKRQYGADHVSEMTLLRIAMSHAIIDTFSIIPEDNCYMCFDPGSYGQFLGGTNNGHEEGFKDKKHYPWMFECEAYMKDGKPFVKRNGIEKPLFNLHVHSKRLELFI